MENLTKQQIVLLTLLVSFVTSIATGIVTVSLMNQAPLGVVQTINRVVEKTIETVTPPSIKETQTVVKETVVVSVDDQIVNAVEKNSKNIIRIYRTNTDPSADSSQMVFVGLGAIVSSDGIIATDNNLISDGGKYFATPSDKLLNLSVVRSVKGEKIALLKIKNDDKISYPTVTLTKSDLKLGQAVIYIGGESKDSVFTGIISGLSAKEIKNLENSTSTPTTKISSIETSVSTNFISGGLLLNLSGELIGIKTVIIDSSKNNLFTPSFDIAEVLSAISTSTSKTE